MNGISRKPAQTAAGFESARQHQKSGRPSWSARWMAKARALMSRNGGVPVVCPRAGTPGFAHSSAEKKPKQNFALTREKKKKKSTKTPPQKHKNTKKDEKKHPNCFSALTRESKPHPRHPNGNSHMALGNRRSERTTAGSALGCARGRHPRLGLAMRCGDLALSQKNMPFCAFFHVQPKHPNDAIFVNIDGFRPCVSKPSYGAPLMFPHGPPNAKGTAETAPEIAILENQAIWVILIILAKQAIWAILAHHFRARTDFPQKTSIWGLA